MGFLIGLLPALFWGFTPVLVSKLGGKPINQQLGTSFGLFSSPPSHWPL